MSKIEILVTGRNEAELQPILTLINDNDDWITTSATTDEEAIEKFHQRNFDIVVLTNDMGEEEDRKLRKIFTIQNPDIIILAHSIEDNRLLTAAIGVALDKRRQEKKPTFSFVDDALKDAGLNIIVQ